MDYQELLKSKAVWIGAAVILVLFLLSRKSNNSSSGVNSEALQAGLDAQNAAAERSDAYKLEVLRLSNEREMAQLSAVNQLEYLKLLTASQLATSGQQYQFENEAQRNAYNSQLRNDILGQVTQGIGQLLQRLGQGQSRGSSSGSPSGSSGYPQNGQRQGNNPLQDLFNRLFNRPVSLPNITYDAGYDLSLPDMYTSYDPTGGFNWDSFLYNNNFDSPLPQGSVTSDFSFGDVIVPGSGNYNDYAYWSDNNYWDSQILWEIGG